MVGMTANANVLPTGSVQENGGLVAIVGMAGRLPGAATVDEFRQNLLDGAESISFFDEEQLRAAGEPERSLTDPSYVNAAPVIDDVDAFDAALFGMSSREAELLDPQFRVLLEVCHSALQHAGISPGRFPGRIGVYAGSRSNSYFEKNIRRNGSIMRATNRLMVEASNYTDYVSTSVAYRLGLTGPALNIVTACSTSLVAVHTAVRALRGRECDAALAGGVEIDLPQVSGYRYHEGGVCSRDGHIRAFDAKASGTVFGNGCGIVVLKRLDDALADRDTIHAVIRGCAINNDGNGKDGFFAPSARGQVAVLEASLADAGIDPGSIGYVEAHGTATLIGDPIEASALTAVLGRDGARPGGCVISSVKSNVGHLGAAAGVTGLINATFSVRDGVLAPSINFDEPNPRINIEDGPLRVSTTLRDWAGSGGPRRAAVNSFGIGGTNANVILEQPPAAGPPAAPSRPYQLITLSARSTAALDRASGDLAGHLARHETELADVAYTLCGRDALGVRRFAVAGDTAEARDRLGSGPPAFTARPDRAPVFLFPGQGAQYPGMAREIYELEPVFRDEVDRCAAVLAASHGLDLRNLLFCADTAALAQTAATQPALYAVEYALAKLLRSVGVEPAAMAGHSVGEYVAATLAGVLEPDDALRLVADRGALMQSLGEGGAMLAVSVPEELLPSLIPPSLDIAAVNAPGVCVLSGPRDEIERLDDELSGQGVSCQLLHTSHAFHSRLMDPILDEFRRRVAAVQLRPPSIPFVSNLTGTWITPDQAVDPEYWVRHVRGCVRFSDALRCLAGGNRILVEVGPGRTLTRLAALHDRDAAAVPLMRHPQDETPDGRALLEGIGRLWAEGVAVDWQRFWSLDRRQTVPLPAYPYERKRHWIDPDESPEPPVGDAAPFSVPVWREQPPVTPRRAEGTWVVFAPAGDGPLASLARTAEAAGADVVRADAGSDQSGLFGAMAQDPPKKITVVHGLTAVARPPDLTEDQCPQRWLDDGFHAALASLQHTARLLPTTAVDLVIVTTDMQDVAGLGRVEPAKAAVLGLVKVAHMEFEAVRCRSVDFAGDASPDLAARQLIAEITSGGAGEQVAYRGRKRWAWSFADISVTAPPGAPPVLKERGVYLVTGGLGGLGLVLAEQLARWVRARLVLIGLEVLPERADWPKVLAAFPGGTAAAKIRGVQAVEAAGGEVLVAAADATDEARMRALREATESRFGPVDGIFHLAGIAGGGMLETRSRDDAQQVIGSKILGAYLLDRIFAPELFVLYSSIAAVTGYFGLGDYAGANAALDAYAQARWAEGRRVLSICWPAWSGTGMASKIEQPEILAELSSSTAAEATTVRPVGHPLLRRRSEYPDGTVTFELDLTPQLWVLADHRLSGVPTMPGTGIVELIRAAFQDVTGEPTAQIENLVFLQPLACTAGLTAQLELRPAGRRFAVKLVGSDGAEYANGRLGPIPPGPAPRHDLAALRGRCPADAAPRFDGTAGLVEFGPRWQVAGSRRAGEGAELVGVALPEEFAADLGDYCLHPAMLDWCTGVGQILRGDADYLPFSYDKIIIRAPLPARAFSYIRHLDDTTGDVTSADISIMDGSGSELVSVEGFAMAQPGGAGPGGPAGAAGQAGAPGAADAAPSDRQVSVAAGCEALRLVLGSGLGPQVIWSPGGLDQALRRATKVTRAAIAERMTAASGSVSGSARDLEVPYAEPTTDLERQLAALWADTLGVERVGIDDEFIELGGNSLFAVQLTRRIAESFAVRASVALLLDSPTVRTLAAAIEQVRETGAMPAGEPLMPAAASGPA
jgi:acyl transferase domain-containing protein